jgi:hypothetical protein
MRRYLLFGALALAAVSMTGCHGGSSSVVPNTLGGPGAASQSTTTAPGLSGSVDFTVTVPASGSGIPQSMVVTLVQGAGPSVHMTPLTMNLNLSTYGCMSLTGGGLKCIAAVTAPSGNDTFSITTFGGPNGTGARLSTAQSKTNVIASSLSKTACAPTSSDLAALQSAR